MRWWEVRWWDGEIVGGEIVGWMVMDGDGGWMICHAQGGRVTARIRGSRPHGQILSESERDLACAGACPGNSASEPFLPPVPEVAPLSVQQRPYSCII